MRRNISISLKKELIENIDTLRGDIPRSRFIESRLKKKLPVEGSVPLPAVQPAIPIEGDIRGQATTNVGALLSQPNSPGEEDE
jgi:hypothetical protein